MLTIGSAVGATVDPWRRGDLVGVLGETTGVSALRAMRDKMSGTAEGRRVLFERPRVGPEVLARVEACADGTLGAAYLAYMKTHGFKPEERTAVRFVDDAELAFVMTRYRETHDFVHAVTGLNDTVAEEMVLKAFEWRQTGLPMTGLASLGGSVHLSGAELRYFVEKGLPWAHQAAQGELSVSVMWEELFDTPVDQVRADLLIPAAPLPPTASGS